MNNKILSHVSFGLVTYGALLAYLLLTFITADQSDIDELSGLKFFGFFATFMTFFGWIFIIPAFGISIKGLLKKDNTILNSVTLLICIIWLAVGYWVMTHFA